MGNRIFSVSWSLQKIVDFKLQLCFAAVMIQCFVSCVGENKKNGNHIMFCKGSLSQRFLVFCFLSISLIWVQPRNLLTRSVNFCPFSQVPSSPLMMKDLGVSGFYPELRLWGPGWSAPLRGGCNSIFCRNHRTRYSRGWGQRAGEKGNVAMKV